MKTLLMIILTFCCTANADQPLPGVWRDSQTIIQIYKGEKFKFNVIRNHNKLDDLALEKIARARHNSGVLMEYAEVIPGTETKFIKHLYLPFDNEENVTFKSMEGNNNKYKVPLIIFTAYLEGKIEILWSEWIDH